MTKRQQEQLERTIRRNTIDVLLHLGDREARRRGAELPARPLPPRLDLVNHSPTGFGWSYGGSGPAQLALAILADFLADDEQALGLYQQFKWAVVAQLPHAAWTLKETDVRAACERIK
jgi:hypothetical protein